MMWPHLGVSQEVVSGRGRTLLPRDEVHISHSKPNADYCDASGALARTSWIGPSMSQSGPAAMPCLSYLQLAPFTFLIVYKATRFSRFEHHQFSITALPTPCQSRLTRELPIFF